MSAGDQPPAAYGPLLRAITERLDWRLAAAWEPATADGGTLACVACWTTAPELTPFADVTRTTILRAGEGLPGRVYSSGAPEWLTDASVDDRLPRRDAARAAGLHAAVAFPVRSERGTVGVVELFADRPREPDPELLATLELLGTLLGQLVERRLADSRHRLTLQAALDCVVTMDAAGRVVAFNPAAERTFGYTSAEAVGRDMADLIVPPELREPHRAGLRRYLATSEPHLLDRRIVEAADEARRRIERDLHDGAQQQLVSLAVGLRLARRRLDQGDATTARELLDEAGASLTEALAELRELARGIHPAVLTEGGLAPAIGGLVRRSAVAAHVAAVPEDRRFAPAVEAAAYFLVAEGLTNAARHAGAHAVEIEVRADDAVLVVEVRDDGAGGADPDGGGLRGLADRLAVLQGALSVSSPPSGGTVLRGEIPCAS